MIPRGCKRLAEVDFPIAAVSRHAAREKSIRHGHPSTLHLWWARRPLASSRAVLLALLWPDPCDALCPAAFKEAARALLPPIPHCNPGAGDAALRAALLCFIADFANWDLAAHADYLRVSRALVKAVHGEEAPLVVDPFAGGGSIPLEALRLGCEAFASDLNPVACLILKVMLEDIPRRGPALADELRAAGAAIRDAAAKELAGLYPKDADGAVPIAYLWARTVRCEAPRCGAEIPLMRSFWLARKPKRKRALRPRIERPEGSPPHVALEVFEPQAESEVRAGTVTRARATCPCCESVLPPERVRAQLAERRGGADAVFDEAGRRVGGARLTAVVTLKPGEAGRHYRLPTAADHAAVRRAQERLAEILDAWERGGRRGLCPVPNELISRNELRRISVPIYGMTTWGDLFTARQKVALAVLCNLVTSKVSEGIRNVCGLSVSKLSEVASSICAWEPLAECPRHVFSRQAIPITWDFGESAIMSSSSGSFEVSTRNVCMGIEATKHTSRLSSVQIADATEHPLPDEAADVWFTDPPYYDAVPYAHLADFFFVWLKRIAPCTIEFQDITNPCNLTPKEKEIVVDRPHRLSSSTKTAEVYESGMAQAFAEGRRVLRGDGVGSVVFAHKTTEGWEALLAGMIRGGWTITGSWPVATEMGSRLNARETASLATSVHLICRPRPADAPVGDWVDVLRALPRRVAAWMARLQGEGVRGADLVFACIGPALEIFSRCRAVETAEGREVGLAEYLEKVWEVVGRAALRQVLGAAEAGENATGALEEDARLTALFLWTLQSTEAAGTEDASTGAAGTGTADANGRADDEDEEAAAKGVALPFDVVRRFAQPMGIDLERWTGRVVGQSKGVVRLLPVAERARDLFGAAGAETVAGRIEAAPGDDLQGSLFAELEGAPPPRPRGRGRRIVSDAEVAPGRPGATVLDRVHAAMLLQAGGHAVALRALIEAEQERGPDFLRLANALSALYPRGGREKRLLDAMLLAAPR